MTIGGIETFRCPLRLFLDAPGDMTELLWYYNRYKQGMLPEVGGLDDQPAVLMAQFRVIDMAAATIENAQRAEQERLQRVAQANASRGASGQRR